MKLKPHNFFTILCLAVFFLSVFVVVSSKTGFLNGKSSTSTNGGVIVGKTTAVKMFLEVTSPENGSTIETSSVLVKGKTVSKAEVFINEAETKANSQGNFSTKLDLDEGENIINVAANDTDGNYLETEITVMVETF